jgi:hypothetical protein
MVKKKRIIRRTRRVVRHTAAAKTTTIKIAKPPEKPVIKKTGINEAAKRAMAGPDINMPDEKRSREEKKIIKDQGWRNT